MGEGPRAWLAGTGPRAPDVGPRVPVASRLASGSLGFLVRQEVASQGARSNQALSASLPGSKGVGVGVCTPGVSPRTGPAGGSGSSEAPRLCSGLCPRAAGDWLGVVLAGPA